MARILYAEYRTEFAQAKYPFSDTATLINNAGDQFPPDLLLDAALHIPGAGPRLHLAKVLVDFSSISITVTDEASGLSASGDFDPNNPSDSVTLYDARKRPAGLLVSTADRLKTFQAWGLGSHLFELSQTEFASACCWPVPSYGVEGVVLPGGELLANEIWLAGGDGVVLSTESLADPENPGSFVTVIRVDVIGDPLFRRRLCAGVFQDRNFLRSVTFRQGCKVVQAEPDEFGVIVLSTSGLDTPDTCLRIYPTDSGLFIGVAGEQMEQF